MIADPLPIGITRQTLTDGREALQSLMEPPTAEQWAVAIGTLKRLSENMRIEVKDWGWMTQAYREGLDGLPADLLALAIRRTVAGWSNGYRMPLPAEIRATVAGDLERRALDGAKIETALMVATRTGSRRETREQAEARRKDRARMIDEQHRPVGQIEESENG
jgi:hypothetical protein